MRLLMTCAVLVCAVLAWLGFAAAGWPGLAVTACAVLALVTVGARLAAVAVPPGVEREAAVHADQVGRYPQYERLAAELRWALGDGRYFANILAPHLRQLAHDVGAHRRGRPIPDEYLETELGAEVSRSLTVAPGSRDRDDRPNVDEIAGILSALERL